MRPTFNRTQKPGSFAEPDTHRQRQSTGQLNDGGFEEEEEVVASSSSAAVPPPYSRNRPLVNPFLDVSGSNVMRKGLTQAEPADVEAALPTTGMLIEPLPALPTDMGLDESFPLPLPYQPPRLSRGLQIPSRVSLITWGFSLPKVLPMQGVSEGQWRLFKHELERFARMTMSQRLTVWGVDFLVSHSFGHIVG